jgi:hypothetical protein
MNDGVHRAELVDLVSEVAGLLNAGKIANDQGRTAIDQVGQRGRAVGVAGVNDNLVPFVEQGGGGGSTEPLGGTGDQDASHERSFRTLVN